jgi:hypothetical protein
MFDGNSAAGGVNAFDVAHQKTRSDEGALAINLLLFISLSDV